MEQNEETDEDELGYSTDSRSIGSVDGILDSDVDDQSNDVSSGETGDELPIGIEELLSDSNDEEEGDEEEPDGELVEDSDGEEAEVKIESDNTDDGDEAGIVSDSEETSVEKNDEKTSFEDQAPISNKRVYLQVGGKRHRTSSEAYPSEAQASNVEEDEDETDFEHEDEGAEAAVEDAQESTVEDMISLIGESMSSNQVVMGWNWKPVRAAAAAALEEISSGKTQSQLHELRKRVYLLKPNVPRGKSRRSQMFKPKPSNKVRINKGSTSMTGLEVVHWAHVNGTRIERGDICGHRVVDLEQKHADIYFCQAKEFYRIDSVTYCQVQWLIPKEQYRPWNHLSTFRWEYFERPNDPNDKETVIPVSCLIWVAPCYDGYYESAIKKEFPGFVPLPSTNSIPAPDEESHNQINDQK